MARASIFRFDYSFAVVWINSDSDDHMFICSLSERFDFWKQRPYRSDYLRIVRWAAKF